MSLQNVTIKKEYRSLIDQMAHDFYIPLLQEAVTYNRAVGFFSSSILSQISSGILGIVKNKGHIRLIASPYLSDSDVEAIRLGYNMRGVISDALLRELKEPQDAIEEEQLNFLSNLISDGYLDIKIAVVESVSGLGMYHEKVGIIKDADNNAVAFSGSMNESSNALISNYESIDVFCSWLDERDRVISKEKAFDILWDDYEENVRVFEFSNVTDEFIKKYKKAPVRYDDYKEPVRVSSNTLSFFEYADSNNSFASDQLVRDNRFFVKPHNVGFYDYQIQAIEAWKKMKFCGMFNMATGTGKTYTALGALCLLSAVTYHHLAVIIVVPYQHLVEQWIEDIEQFNIRPIVAYSYPGQNWRTEFRNAVTGYNIGAIDNFCIITTNATFALPDFQEICGKFRRDFCFVADEAHNFGAKKLRELLPKKARYRLALSATLNRFRDESGTNSLCQYFGRICFDFNLKDAIMNGFLTPYYYYPVVNFLSGDELENYKELTRLIVKNGGGSKENCELNPYVELLLIKRARIISGCRDKIKNLIEVIEPFQKDNHLLIYCGATKYDNGEIDDSSQIKQIDEVCRQLKKNYHMHVCKFTAEENKEERQAIREEFVSGDQLQAIAAIKCLDEGVNIPAIEKAFILASSTNPKEYIQRRGRVLRRFEGKKHAVIYDFITLPRPLEDVMYCSAEEIKSDLTLVKREFTRMNEFADSSQNPSSVDQLRVMIQDAYHNVMAGGMIDE